MLQIQKTITSKILVDSNRYNHYRNEDFIIFAIKLG